MLRWCVEKIGVNGMTGVLSEGGALKPGHITFAQRECLF